MTSMYPRIHGILANLASFNCDSVNWTTDRFALYEFENNLNLGEDTQGSLDLTNVNGVTQVAGIVGNAANFVGASLQYFEVPFTGSTFDLTGDWSISCWAKISDGPDVETIFRVIDTVGGFSVIRLELQQPTKIRAVWRDRDLATQTNVSYSGIVPDVWHHYVMTKNGVTAGLYMDGIDNGARGGTVPDIPTLNQELTDVFRVFRGDLVYADGDIDQLAIWDRVLSADEVSCLYNSGNGIAI